MNSNRYVSGGIGRLYRPGFATTLYDPDPTGGGGGGAPAPAPAPAPVALAPEDAELLRSLREALGPDIRNPGGLLKGLVAERVRNKELLQENSSLKNDPEYKNLIDRDNAREKELATLRLENAHAKAWKEAKKTIPEGHVLHDEDGAFELFTSAARDPETVGDMAARYMKLALRQAPTPTPDNPIPGQPPKGKSPVDGKSWKELTDSDKSELYKTDRSRYEQLRSEGAKYTPRQR